MIEWNRVYLKETASTNEDAKKLIDSENEYLNYVISAEQQTSGKGRYDRVWQSPVGNLYCSFIVENKDASYHSFVAAVATIETIREICPSIEISCKWPNDVLVEGAKISGILLEVYKDALIIGIGVNILSSPSSAHYKTACLRDFDCDISSEDLLAVLAGKLSENTSLLKNTGFETVRKKWVEFAHNIGKEIQVNLINESTKGIFKGISEQGALLIDTGDEIKKIMAGDVFYL